MQKTHFERLINFLLGLSWAVSVLGAVLLFRFFSDFGIFVSLSMALFGATPGLMMVIVLEYMMFKIAQQTTSERQTELLEDISTALKALHSDKISDQ